MSHIRMLLQYDLPGARRTVLGLFPELRRAITVASVLTYLTNTEAFDAEARELACDISKALWYYTGVVQEARRETFGIAERLAVARLKQAMRDLCLSLCWPTNRNSGEYHLELDQRAIVALARLRRYDRLQGPSSYVGNMAADVLALANGVRPSRAEDE